MSTNGTSGDRWLIPYGLVVRIPAFHAGGPGSIPGVGASILHKQERLPGMIFSLSYNFAMCSAKVF